MSQKFIFHADATRPGVEANCKAFLDRLPKDKAWQVEIKAYRKTRSLAQNAYMWSVVYRAFMDELPGWDAQDVHDYLLGEHFGWETIEGFGRKRMKPIRRSSKLDKREFAEYVDFCIRKATEIGLFVPLPGEDIYEQR